MKNPLLRYYSQEVSAWIYVAPLVYTLFGCILLFDGVEIAVYFMLMLCVTSICAIYFDKREKEFLMTSLFPISNKTFFMVDLLFIGRIILGYYLYSLAISTLLSSLYHQTLVLPSSKQLIFSAVICFFITALFFFVRSFKFRQYINLSILAFPILFAILIPSIKSLTLYHCLLFLTLSVVLFIIATILTFTYEGRRDIS